MHQRSLQTNSNTNNKKRNITIILIILFALSALALIYFFESSTTHSSTSSSSEIQQQNQVIHLSSSEKKRGEEQKKENYDDNQKVEDNKNKKVSSDEKQSLENLLSERGKLLAENEELKFQIEKFKRKMNNRESNDDEDSNTNVQQKQKQQQSSDMMNKFDSSSSSEIKKPDPWLIIGIPTVPREEADSSNNNNNNARPVLLRTLESLRAQIYAPSSFGSLFFSNNNNNNKKHSHNENKKKTKKDDGGVFLDTSFLKVVVLNQRPGSHLAFEQAKQQFKNEPWIEFYENFSPYNDPPFSNSTDTSDLPEFRFKSQQKPTEAVRRQTLDVTSLLDIVVGKSQYFLFYEDDFHFCDNALLHLINLIERANFYFGQDSWSAIRCSFGLAGIVMQNGGLKKESVLLSDSEKRKRKHKNQFLESNENNNKDDNNNDDNNKNDDGDNNDNDVDLDDRKSLITTTHNDVAALRDYFLLHVMRRPPDHLAVEFYARESSDSKKYFSHENSNHKRKRRVWGFDNNADTIININNNRKVVAYRYNILRHDGEKSTLRPDQGWSMPGCFEELVVPQVFEVEAWDKKQCPDSDIWPCEYARRRKHLLKKDRRRGDGFTDISSAQIQERDA